METGSEDTVERVEAEAAAWAAKLDAAPERVLSELDEWLARDPKHAGALLRAQATLALFDPEPHVQGVPSQGKTAFGWKRRTIWGGGATALAASLAAFLLLVLPNEAYETQLGEIRKVALSDGSSVVIDAKSRIEVDFNAERRDIHLHSGKVLFRAAHSEERPFRVIMGDIVVTDIGTAFQITNDDLSAEIDVLVTEGAVKVDTPAGHINLVAGQQARFSKAGPPRGLPTAVRIAPADIERSLAWRDSRLDLNGETLDTAVAEINRHSRLQLRVGTAALGREKLYGSFRVDDAAGFARAVAQGLGAEARSGPDGIVIEPKKK